jgi:ribonuclease PH
MRPSGRDATALRQVSFDIDVNKYAEGSCLVRFGDTHVLCMASVEESTPSWLRNTGKGWITAEYGMLPRATNSRMDREAARGRQSGRTQEIQRLIGRSLRAVTNLSGFGERQIRIDCDVLQADGGTRTAAVTGGYVALYLAFRHLKEIGALTTVPLTDQVGAVSCGICEDSTAQTDANFVLTSKGGIVEVQATAEQEPFTRAEFDALYELAAAGIRELTALQRQVLGIAEDA